MTRQLFASFVASRNSSPSNAIICGLLGARVLRV